MASYLAMFVRPPPRRLPLHLPPFPGPVQPTARILPDLFPARILCQVRRRPAPYAGTAVEDYLGIGRGARVPEPVLEFLSGDVKAFGISGHRNVNRPRDEAGFFELVRFADIYVEGKSVGNNVRKSSKKGGRGRAVPMSVTEGVGSVVSFRIFG